MNQIKINFILPFFPKSPGGGVKVIYEYADRLSKKGYDVCIYHSLKTSYTRRVNTSKPGIVLEYLIRMLKGKIKSKPVWFEFDSKIESRIIPYISDRWIREADFIVSTWWATAIDISKLSSCKGRSVNLIQDIETNMSKFPELVYDSYRLNTQHVAISDYIRTTVQNYSGTEIPVILNGIDLKKYVLQNPISSRKRYSVIMLYANHERKGSKYGIEALKILKQKHPLLEVSLFTTEQPENMPELPEWIKVHFNPGNLVELYNQAAIFLSPSIQEGLALPPMEAMACGCACVCTAIGGHQYLENGSNSLSVEPRNPQMIVDKISTLLEDDNLRQEIAGNGYKYIQKYSWDYAIEQLETIFENLKVRDNN